MIKCKECKKKIDEKEKYVDIQTKNMKGKKDLHERFHFDCWIKHFNDCVEKRITNMQQVLIKTISDPKLVKTMKGAMNIFIKDGKKRKTN